MFKSWKDIRTVENAPAYTLEAEMARTLQVNLRRFLLFAVLYFVINSLFYRVEGDVGYIPALSVFTTLVLLGFWWFNHGQASMLRLELTGHICCWLLVVNGFLDICLEYKPVKLMYMLLLLPAFAVSAVSLRVILNGSIAAFAAFLWAAWRYDPPLFVDCLWVAFCALIIGVALSIIIRSTMLSAVRARISADHHRDEALSLARFDALTGLPNRRAFLSEVHARLSAKTAFHLGLIDLDGFKPINDIYGHAAGDLVLSQVAVRLRQVCGDEAIVARLGGDEFAVLLFGAEEEAQWRDIADSIGHALSQPYPIDNETAHISASLGFTLRSYDMEVTSSRLLERADYALYEAKEGGRGIAILFDRTHEELIRATKAVEQALRAIDGQKELSLAFQPQYDTRQGRTVAFEALARWENERLGPVAPDMFIRAAERSGRITDLTPILLEKALKTAREWPEHIRLAFNLSARDLLSPVAVSRIVAVVNASDVNPSRMEFEITETAMISDFAQARKAIACLSGMGCRIALDDFGSGYTNFGHLNQVKVDTVKVDRSFVLALGHNDRACKIIKSMIELADNLGMSHVIEGVETQEQLAQLTEAGAIHVQGYLFARPMPAQDIAGFLERERKDRAPDQFRA